MKMDADSAQVRIPPPLIVISFVLVGVALHWTYPIQFATGILRWATAIIFGLLGVSIIGYCLLLFRRSETNIEPWKTTARLVTTGIYSYSRNPIYVAFMLIGMGIAFAMNSLWIVLMLVPATLAIDRYVIAREEKYLAGKFGAEYAAYCKSVRRWI